MIYALIASILTNLLVVAMLVGYVHVERERQLAQGRLEAEGRAELVVLVTELITQARDERQLLLTRIQAPEVAVAQTIAPPEGLQHVPVDDDEAFWAAREEQVNGNG